MSSTTRALAYVNTQMAEIVEHAPVRMSARDALDHLADLLRTRITPGADPRVPWERSHGFGQFETGTRALPRAVSIITASRTDGYRYVPEDVRRWRNSAHRAALAERARAYAIDRVKYARLAT